MPVLSVSKFSCLDKADVELGLLTIIIGPQASGKSIISKLIYFCNDIIFQQYAHIEDEKPLSEFADTIAKMFTQWFPLTGWGGQPIRNSL